MGEITLKKALDDYKSVYLAYRNFADRTREEYLNDLEDLVRVLQKVGIQNVGEVSVPIIERYIARLEQKGFASLTRKRKVVAIRSFLSFLYQDGYITTNLAKRVVVPFVEYTSPNFLTQRECNRLREACSANPRDSAIIELILQTGIKLSELVHLTLDDIELDETGNVKGFIRIKGSVRNKERIIPLNTIACEAISRYLSFRGNIGDNVFFTNKFGEQLGERGIQKILTKYLKAAKIERASARTLRHTFGAYHIARGTNPKLVQEVMGFKDDRSAEIYQVLANKVMLREMQENSI